MKLIRDRTPDLERGSTRLARDDDEYNILLRAKVMEEAAEVAASTSKKEMILELADLMTVSIVLAMQLGIEMADVETAIEEKWNRKGGFSGRLVLIHDPLSNKTTATV